MEFYEVIKTRKSVRKYRPDPIPEDVLNRILEAGRAAPSAKNIQPWKFIVIKDPENKKKVAEVCRGQHWIANADVIVCGCALEKIAWGRMGGYMSSFAVDLAIAMDHIILAAANEGLGTCWIAAFDPGAAQKILDLPAGVEPVAFTPLGYPADLPKPKNRKAIEDLIRWEKW